MPKQTFTEAERQERREADRRRTREAVEALRVSEGWQQWLRLRHRFRTYSLTNQLLIAVAMPDATRGLPWTVRKVGLAYGRWSYATQHYRTGRVPQGARITTHRAGLREGA